MLEKYIFKDHIKIFALGLLISRTDPENMGRDGFTIFTREFGWIGHFGLNPPVVHPLVMLHMEMIRSTKIVET